MTEKAIVTKEQAELIEHLKGRWGVDLFIRFHSKYGWKVPKYYPLNDLTTEDLSKALINGYEVEKSPEEILCEWYELVEDLHEDLGHDYDCGILFGICNTLHILGIKIEGIND